MNQCISLLVHLLMILLLDFWRNLTADPSILYAWTSERHKQNCSYKMLTSLSKARIAV